MIFYTISSGFLYTLEISLFLKTKKKSSGTIITFIMKFCKKNQDDGDTYVTRIIAKTVLKICFDPINVRPRSQSLKLMNLHCML